MGNARAGARYRELGYELQKRRDAAGLTGRDIAESLGWSRAKVGRIEVGTYKLDPVEMIEYLGACGIMRAQAMDLLVKCRAATECSHAYWLSPHEPGLPDRTWSLIYYEATASASTCYEPQLIPGLLQTESYIRAITAERWPQWDLDLAVRIRTERQRILHRPTPCQFTFFISDQALRLTVGDAAVMQEQLLALTLVDALPHVAIRVVPGAATFGGAFVLFEFAQYRPLVYLDAYVGDFFLEDKEYVNPYGQLVRVIADAALDEGESREFVANLAYEYDRGSTPNNVAEEQFQR